MSAGQNYQIRPCTLCKNEDYIKAPMTTQKFDDGEAAVFICKECGMTPTFSTYDSRYEKIMKEEYYHDDLYSAKGSQDTYEKNIDNRFDSIEKIRPLKGRLLFDIGCGEGILLKLAQKRGADVFGLEPDGSEVKNVREQGIEVFEGLLEDLPMADHKGKYDIITLTWVLDAMMDPVMELKRVRQLLKPDGILHISVSSHYMSPILRPLSVKKRSFPTIIHKPLKNMIGNKQVADIHPFYFTRKSLRACLEHVGFNIEFINPDEERVIYLNATIANEKPLQDIEKQSVSALKMYFLKLGVFDLLIRDFYEAIVRFAVKIRNKLKT